MNGKKKKIQILFLLFLNILFGNNCYAYSSISAGAFQGYQVIIQKESLYNSTITLASLPTIGAQLQYQTTLGQRFAFRFKLEAINIKYMTPPEGFLTSETFQTVNYTIELPYQHNLHWQSFIKLSSKERILFNLDDTLRISLYKSKIQDYGYGINYDTQNLGGLVIGVGSTLSLLNFKSKDINDTPANNFGVDFEMRGKLGWIYQNGWGNIFRVNYSNFYMPNDIDKNIGKELRFFGEILKSF